MQSIPDSVNKCLNSINIVFYFIKQIVNIRNDDKRAQNFGYKYYLHFLNFIIKLKRSTAQNKPSSAKTVY